MRPLRQGVEGLKKKWDIKSTFDFWMIMLTFSLAGINVSLSRAPIFHILGFTAKTALWLKTLSYLLFIFPIYQISLLFYGLLLGQFAFFWKKEKALAHWLAQRIFKKYTALNK